MEVLIAGLLLGVVGLHPFLTYPLSLAWLARIRPRQAQPAPAAGQLPSFTICMCAYNEERVIEAKMENLLRLRDRHPGLEIRVYVDAAVDRTAEKLQPYRDRISLHISPERHGKTWGMNLLVAGASGSILVFTDANVMIDDEALERLADHFADPKVGCVSAHLEYTNPGASAAAATGSLYWRLEEWIKRAEGRIGSVMGADGSLFAIRRALHRPPPADIIDDMFVSFSVLCAGYRLVQAEDVLAYEESVTANGEEFRRKVRIGCQAFNVHRLIWPELRRLGPLTVYQYLSHKFLRWVSIYFLVASAVAVLSGLILIGQGATALWLASAGGAALALGAFTPLTPFAALWSLMTALAGTGLGVWRSLAGERFQTWSPATSIRK